MSTPSGARPSIWLPLSAALALSVLAGYIGWNLGSASGASTAAEAQSHPPILTEFRLESLDGEVLGPADYRGKVLLVDFWATWCGPCKVQDRLLEPIWEEVRDQDVQFLAVSLGESRDTVSAFVEKHPYPYPVLIDPEDTIAVQGQIYVLPTIMILDARGRVSYLHRGISDARKLRAALGEAGLDVGAPAPAL